MRTIHRGRFWLAMLGGAVGAVVAAAELSAVDQPSAVTVALWSTAGLASIAVAGWEHRRTSVDQGREELARNEVAVEADTVDGDLTVVDADHLPDSGIDSRATIRRVGPTGCVRGLLLRRGDDSVRRGTHRDRE